MDTNLVKWLLVCFASWSFLSYAGSSCMRPKAEFVGNFFLQSSTPVEFQHAIYFNAWDNGLGRIVFLRFDGQKAEPVPSLEKNHLQSVDDLIVYHDQLYFTALHPVMGRSLWRFDGNTTEFAGDLSKITFGVLKPIIFNDTLYFRGLGDNHLSLYKTTGDQHISLVDGIRYPAAKMLYKNKLFVHGLGNSGPLGLYGYDGSTFSLFFPWAGDMGPFVPLDPTQQTLYFIGTEGMLTSDGYLQSYGETGVNRVGKTQVSIYSKLVPYKGSLYYISAFLEGLIRFDGQRETPLLDTTKAQGDPILFKDQLFFLNSDATHFNDLFVYDGEKVSFLLATNPDSITGSSQFFIFQDQLYFTAHSGGNKTWRLFCQ